MTAWAMYAMALTPSAVFIAFALAEHGFVGALIASALSAGATVAHLRARRFRPLEAALLAYFLATIPAFLAGMPTSAAIWGVYEVAGVAGLATCLVGRPWSVAYDPESGGPNHELALFRRIHTAMSALWATLFLAVAALGSAGVATGLALAPVGLGVLATLFGPKAWVRVTLLRTLAAQETYRWAPTPRAPCRDEAAYDVAVIGAGLGGLTAAALLAQAGLRVFVAEQHSEAGGFCHSFLRKARVRGQSALFRFDAGVHDVTGVREGGTVSGLLDRLGVSLDWVRMQQSQWIDGRLERTPEDWRAYVTELGRRHPSCAGEIARFFETAKTIYDGLFFGAERTSGVPLGPQSIAEMMRMLELHPLVPRWMDRPFLEFLCAFDLTEAARAELSRLSAYVSDDLAQLTVFDMIPLYGFLFHGGFYPRGGSGALAERLVDAFVRDGGDLALRTPVAEILVEGGAACGLRLADGRVVRAGAVVSNADLRRTLVELTPGAPAAVRAAFAAVEPAASAFAVHLGLDRQPDMAAIAEVEDEDGRMIGLISPSAADPTAAAPGLATLELLALVSHREALTWFRDPEGRDDKAWRRSANYQARKRAFADGMIRAAERALPGLAASIVFRAEASPVTFQRYAWTSAGAIYGVAKAQRWKGCKSPICDLWFAGSGNHGPGVEAAMIAGAKTAEAIHPGVLAPFAAAPLKATPATAAPERILQPA